MPGFPPDSLSLCVRGHYGQDALSTAERLSEPLVRQETGNLREASWEEAIGEVTRRLNEVIEQFGPESVGIIVGAQCSNEEVYLAVRLARAVSGNAAYRHNRQVYVRHGGRRSRCFFVQNTPSGAVLERIQEARNHNAHGGQA